MSRRKTTEEFIADAREVHGDRYDYSEVEYERCGEEVKIGCKTCGEFNQTPRTHLSGSGCQKCAAEKASKVTKERHRQEEKIKLWTEEEEQYVKDNYDYEEGTEERIADHLNRTILAVRHKARRLGIRKVFFTKEQLEYIKENYQEKTYYDIAEHLDIPYRRVEYAVNKKLKLPNKNISYDHKGLKKNLRDIYKIHAERRGYTFKLNQDYFSFLLSQPCYYCGIESSNINTAYAINFEYNGIDRVDNELGYSKSNCVPCCKYCNRAKSSFGLDEFLRWLKTINSLKIKDIKEPDTKYYQEVFEEKIKQN